jgi:hypothetical protein
MLNGAGSCDETTGEMAVILWDSVSDGWSHSRQSASGPLTELNPEELLCFEGNEIPVDINC